MPSSGCGHFAAKAEEPGSYPALDCAFWKLKEAANLDVGVSGKVGQCDGFTLGGRKVLKTPGDQPGVAGQQRLYFNVPNNAVVPSVFVGFSGSARRFASKDVDGTSVGDCREVASEGAAGGVEAVWAEPESFENVLHDVFSVRSSASTDGYSEQSLMMSTADLTERRLVRSAISDKINIAATHGDVSFVTCWSVGGRLRRLA